MTHRSTVPQRPWLKGSVYDKYTTPTMLHFDLYAYTDADGYVWFEMRVTHRGMKPVAHSIWRYVPEFDALTERGALAFGLVPLRWRRATHDQFKRVHGRLLEVARGLWPDEPRTILCHYVKPYDADPWPRNTVNTYAPPVYAEGKRPGRPAKPRISAEDTAAINILMGVDTLGVL